jgi:hypothetical protein
MDLLTMMDDEEDNQICQILGIIMHGHVQKLIKCKNRKRPGKHYSEIPRPCSKRVAIQRMK